MLSVLIRRKSKIESYFVFECRSANNYSEEYLCVVDALYYTLKFVFKKCMRNT